MCQLSINNSIEAIAFAGKCRIRFSSQVIYTVAGSNLYKLAANHTMPVFVNQNEG